MWEWLLTPIDPLRDHAVSSAIAWHARLMVFAWGVAAPLAVLVARYFKILPNQNWPVEKDSQFWWRSHWKGQTCVVILSVIAFVFILPLAATPRSLHGWLGYTVLIGAAVQTLLGIFRGRKGGPTDPNPDGSTHGDHYDMTRRRRVFEALHKSIGYLTLILAAGTIVAGMWASNAPNWMWLVITAWWIAIITAFVLLQKRGLAVDTYQAIWGDDPRHPGNQMPEPGWGLHRPSERRKMNEGA